MSRVCNHEFDSEIAVVKLTSWDGYKNGWIPCQRVKQLANRATFIGPLATCIGRQGDIIFQQCDGYVDAEEIEKAIHDEGGISNDDVLNLQATQAMQRSMEEAERRRWENWKRARQ